MDASDGVWKIMVFAHPKCPCTRATLAELDRIVNQNPGGLAATVYFVRPEGAPADWMESPQVQAAQRISHVRVLMDEGGLLANRYGAEASGFTFLVDPSGRCVFEGGITASRGMEGESSGQAAILDLLQGRKPNSSSAPVFGCALGNGVMSERRGE
jgi:hypothetical protein